jgi:flagellar FliJ protein
MKKFRFPLRPVAILRAHRQAQTREAFAAAVHAYVAAEQLLVTARARKSELEAIMHDGRRATFRAADEISFWDAYRGVCDDELKVERTMMEVRQSMELRRQEYLDAHRAVKVVEKLEHKARTIHRQATEHETQVEQDEMAGLRIGRRLSASTLFSA